MRSLVKPQILSQSPTSFIKHLRSLGINAFHATFNSKTGKIEASHPEVKAIGEYFIDEGWDFDKHEGFFGQIGPKSGVLQGAFIHRTCRGSGAGGVRNWHYERVEDWFRDGLRLSRGMTHKNALAELWWGGGKGVLASNSGVGLGLNNGNLEQRRVVFEEYGTFLSELKDDDMVSIYSKTRFTTCIPPEIGGSGSPSFPTACGVVRALEATFLHVGKKLEGSTIAIQGVGHVGKYIMDILIEKGVKSIFASDINSERIKDIKSEIVARNLNDRVKLSLLEGGDLSILFHDVDAIVPCAVGGILNPNTIPRIKTKIVCGAANNQLGDLYKDDKLLADRGIIYVPGIVNCADESAGYVDNDPLFQRHLGDSWENSIFRRTQDILKESSKRGTTPQQVTVELAEKKSFELNPIWGHRGIQIINSVINSNEWKKKIRQSN
ncbi:7415_t:CDS:10 [Entrophospora sp. SA101]|nr:7415_t:CDS:10 [Entrophospora sp. SA101]